MPDRSNTGPARGRRASAAGILAAVTALLLVSVIAGPVLAQSPSPMETAAATDEASPAASPAASPGGVPSSPSATQPDTAIGSSDPRSTGGDISPIAFLLLGIGVVAAVLVYLGMRGSELRRQPVGSDEDRSA